MTDADRIRAALDQLYWSINGLAEILGVDQRITQRWASAKMPIPPEVLEWLETLAMVHTAHPLPKKWVLTNGEFSQRN